MCRLIASDRDMQPGLLRLAGGLARRLSASRQNAAVAALCSRSLSADAGEQPARERMEYDVCIVGAGPAGLAAAIRFKQVLFCFAPPPPLAAAARRRRCRASALAVVSLRGCVLI